MESSLKLLGEAGVCPGSMNCIEGSDRQQTHLLPAALEDYVGPDNPVRFLDAFVATLDLRAAGFHFPKEDPPGRGRPAYPPADRLKLYLYGYLHQLRSSRRLEAECRRNLPPANAPAFTAKVIFATTPHGMFITVRAGPC